MTAARPSAPPPAPAPAPTPPTRRRRRSRLVIALVALALVAAGCRWVPVPGAPDCRLSPADSYWRARVGGQPVHPSSDAWIDQTGRSASLKADFGSGTWDGGPIGIPYVVVPGDQPRVPVSFTYDDESDPGPYPIPADAPIEGGPASSGDRHILVLDRDACTLYETFSTYPDGAGGWDAGSGAVWGLSSNDLRRDGWTSADAAGLPILPGLVRYEEVAGSGVHHAIRITVPRTRRAYVWPARHFASSSTDPTRPPMGAWLRLKASVDPADFGPQTRPIVEALRTHGAIVADNGSAWYLSGVPDERWDNDQLRQLGDLTGDDFEFVDASSMMVDPDSGRATTAR